MSDEKELQAEQPPCNQSELIETLGTTLTCVYCGTKYPAGTPAHGEQVQALTDHIKACPKHPMREAEVTIVKLRAALVGLIGVDGKEELEQMELAIRVAPAPERDKIVSLNAIHALLDTCT